MNEKILRIVELKDLLKTSDYKVIKCLEAFVSGETMPYNFLELKNERNLWREEIAKLEEELNVKL
jgi:hypothetical protein